MLALLSRAATCSMQVNAGAVLAEAPQPLVQRGDRSRARGRLVQVRAAGREAGVGQAGVGEASVELIAAEPVKELAAAGRHPFLARQLQRCVQRGAASWTQVAGQVRTPARRA